MKKSIKFLFLLIILINLQIKTILALDIEKEDALLKRYIWNEVCNLEDNLRPRVALVLGGGGARGLAHIGVLKVLKEENVPIDIIVGTSVGALIGALYATDERIEDIENMSEDIGWNKLISISSFSPVRLLSLKNIFDSRKTEEYIALRIKNKRFDELKITFACVASDIQTGERIIFRDGLVAPAVRASASVPGLFKPVEYRHRLLVDGGIVDNVPVDIAKMLSADIIIAVVVSGDFTDYDLSNILLILAQVISIQGNQLVSNQLKNADIVIQPQVGDVSIIDLNRGEECIEAGVIATRRNLYKIKELIMNKGFERMLLRKK